MELLELPFEVVVADVDETPLPGEAPERYVRRLARAKAERVAERAPDAFVLGADTTVSLGARILGKPRDRDEAREMLRTLSGQTHRVWTGVGVVSPAGIFDAAVPSEVSFRPLSEREIAWYVDTGEPMDKAGAYAYQGKGGLFVASITGSATNIIGLPLAETLETLRAAGYPAPWEVA